MSRITSKGIFGVLWYGIKQVSLIVLGSALLQFSGCAVATRAPEPPVNDGRFALLFAADRAIQDEWQMIPIRRETEYRLALFDGKIAIRAIGKRSASGLLRRVRIDPSNCPIVSWSWGVERLQESANITVKDKEDVAASLFFLFGDPGFLPTLVSVPSLRYVWTNEKTPTDSIVDSPYLPGVVKSIVMRSGLSASSWAVETRNIAEDFRNAFGYWPTKQIEAIALFTDNDQTREAVTAYYGWGKVFCGK